MNTWDCGCKTGVVGKEFRIHPCEKGMECPVVVAAVTVSDEDGRELEFRTQTDNPYDAHAG